MKIGVIINIPNDILKTNEIYQNFQDIAFKNNIELLFEVNGLKNVDSKFDNDEIDEIKSIIIVSDVEFDVNYFESKKVFKVTYEEAISSVETILNKANEVSNQEFEEDKNINKQRPIRVNKIRVENAIQTKNLENIPTIKNSDSNHSIRKYLVTGSKSIMSFILAASILKIFIYFFNTDIIETSGILRNISYISSAIFALAIPVLSGSIAMSISGEIGFFPGIISGALAGAGGGGFISAIIFGLLCGYFVKFLIRNIKIPQKLEDLNLLIFIPLISILVVGLVILYIWQPLLKSIFRNVEVWVTELNCINVFLASGLTGILASFDLCSSVVSNAVVSSAVNLVNNGEIIIMGSVFASTMVAPFGLALATLFAKDKFEDDELLLGKICWLFGITGISQGVIPFAVSDPSKVISSIMMGSFISGILISLLGCGVNTANGGLLALKSAGEFTGFFGVVLSIIIGSIITGYLYSYLKDYKS